MSVCMYMCVYISSINSSYSFPRPKRTTEAFERPKVLASCESLSLPATHRKLFPIGNVPAESHRPCFTDDFLRAYDIDRQELPDRLWWNALNLLFRGSSLLAVSLLYYGFQPDNFWWELEKPKNLRPRNAVFALAFTAWTLPYMLWGTLGLLIEEGIEQEATIVMKAASCTIDFWEGLWEAVAPVALGFRFLLLSHFLGMTRCFQEKWCGAHQGFHHEPASTHQIREPR